MVGVCNETIFKILHDHLGLTKDSARWAPIMCTSPQKQPSVKCAPVFLDLCDEEGYGVWNRTVSGG